MKKNCIPRLSAVALSAALLLAPAAQALTAEQTRALLNTYYVDPVSEDVLNETSVEAMLAALGDPYTNYYTADQFAGFFESMSDENTVGIGIVYRPTDKGMLISSVVAGSPAEQAGLQAGDRITKIDGKAVADKQAAVVKAWVSGEVGTTLTITYIRGSAEKTITLTRATVPVPTATTSLLDGHVGYIDCDTFGPETLQHFTEGMTANRAQADRWIVDLTGNTGGELNGVVESLGLFLGDDQDLTYFRDGKDQYRRYRSTQDALTMYPTIVSTDRDTASASELFSAAVRDSRQGILVGGRTFGKGIAQGVFSEENMPLIFDGDAITITTDRFYSPGGTANDVVGVIPHLLVGDEYATDVAYLLSTSEPKASSGYENMLRLDLTWRWYIDLDTALSSKYKAAFTALLEAVPADARLMQGDGQGHWVDITPAAVAENHKLSYTARTLADTAESPYARKLDILATYDLIAADEDNNFHPGDALTRGELATMLAYAMRYHPYSGSTQFSDVDTDAWYGEAVNAMAAMGLMGGTGKGLFQPDGVVDHQQLIAVFSNVAERLNLKFYNSARAMEEDDTYLAGLIPFSKWVRPDVWLLAASQKVDGGTLGLLWDKLDKIEPTAAATRGEAAALLYNVFSYTGVIPERIPQQNVSVN